MAEIGDRFSSSDAEEPSGSDQFVERLFWGASFVLALGLISKFASSFRRSHGDERRIPQKEDLQELIRAIGNKMNAIRGIVATQDQPDPYHSTMLVLLHQQTYDLFHELHQELLEVELDAIVDVIPLIDRQLRFWNPKHRLAQNEVEFEHYEMEYMRIKRELKKSGVI